MAQSSIEWTDAVWNPVTGCTKVSQGCAHCYAERMAKRFAGMNGYPADAPFRVTLHPDLICAYEQLPLLRRNWVATSFVVQIVDLVAEPEAHFVDICTFNLHSRGNSGVHRKLSHQTRLFMFDPQVWKKRVAQLLCSLAEHLEAKLRLQIGMTAKIGLIVQFHLSGLQTFGEPFDDASVSHGDDHNGVNRLVAVGADGGDIDGPFTIYQASNVSPFFWSKRLDGVGSLLRRALSPQTQVSRAVILLLAIEARPAVHERHLRSVMKGVCQHAA